MGKRRRSRSDRSWGKRATAERRRFSGRMSSQRRTSSRALRFEPLEERQLLAVGPQLIGINPNTGEVLENGEIRHLAPTELTFRFNEGETINPATLNGIQIRRSGLDGVFGNANDVAIAPSYVAVGEQPNEVIMRFAETLPDDLYRITIYGTGDTPLRNTAGETFNGGVNQSLTFELDLGAQVVAVVPQPTSRSESGALTQARNQIVVYFNNDDLHPTAIATGDLATNPAVVDPRFYQLIYTGNTVTNTDDVVFEPTHISYDPDADSAVLTFATDLASLPTGPGTYRLRIGTAAELPALPTTLTIGNAEDSGASFDTAHDLGVLGTQGQIIDSTILGELYAIAFPGSGEEPGHRDVDIENHVDFVDSTAGISVAYYNFQSEYGTDPLGHQLHNQITPAQKELTRRIFDLFSSYMGIQFVESDTYGMTIVTGDMRVLGADVDTGEGGTIMLSGANLVIMDQAEDWSGEFGGDWFTTAFSGIGNLLGFNDAWELPGWNSMSDPNANEIPGVEPIFPGDHDIIHGTYLYRPEGNDIDLYRFTVEQDGILTAETFAERLTQPGGLPNSSLLDSVVSLYRNLGDQYELIARNDDYFSEDSFLEVAVSAGEYVVVVTASGNREFDPTTEDTGLGGLSEGRYQLRLDFRPIEESVLVDATGTQFDGDADGVPGGTYNFWFRTQTAQHTLIVDKSAVGGTAADGSLAKPYRTLVEAFAAAQFGDVVRVVGNGGADGDLNTVDDNLPYLVGYDQFGRTLQDGATVKVPRGVTLMVDSGAIFKLRKGAFEVGSSATGVDRSAGAMQVLGTPDLPVFFTSYNDENIGEDTNPAVLQIPVAGDWGGIIFRTDLDRAAPSRFDYEAEGIFLNYVNHAEMRYGGGQVVIDSRQQLVTPIYMIDSRPTISFNSITRSADAAMSATPNSFEETNFHSPEYQTIQFSSDYDRVGPDIHGNRLVNNTINGLFIRIRTTAGTALQPLTVSARFDDTDIVHVLTENLVIEGTPGGPVYDDKIGYFVPRLDARLAIDPGLIVKIGAAHIETGFGAQLIAEGVDGKSVVLTSLTDDTYGAGGTADTTNDGATHSPQEGDWGGIYFAHTSTGSLDYATLRYGGGVTRLQGGFAGFNIIEIHQADVRITHSILEYNADGTGGQAPAERYGLMEHEAATIFIRGAQPVLVGNSIRHNAGPAIDINVNALNHYIRTDFGRSTGFVDLIEDCAANHGPLIRGNHLDDNSVNGLVIRGGTLITESVWDDTDIVHVLRGEVIIPNLHTYGGLRLESRPDESLVVKMDNDAGFTASGTPSDIEDRIGGMLHIIGQPGSPVVITSLADDSVGAGVLVDGSSNADTNNDGNASQPTAGDWRSILLTEYSHDRNVAVHTEWESPSLAAPGDNATPDDAEYLGSLAPDEMSTDDTRRLGFTVHGVISEPGDVDVYSFEAVAGTEIWIDIDRTSQALDTVVELIDRNGNVLARSDNSLAEAEDPSLLVGDALLMQKLPPFGGVDFFSLNTKDAGMRLALPGDAGAANVYHLRVRSSSDDLDDLSAGKTSGVYQLQIRLQETDEFAGSNVRYADIRYATNGIEIYGQPIHSPLLGEAAEDDSTNDTDGEAQNLGNFLTSDRAAISVAGILSSSSDVDFYQFEVNYEDREETDYTSPYVGTIFDVDYSDGLARGDITLSVFDSQGRLVYVAYEGTVVDDQTTTPTDLDAGSFGPLDPYLGTIELLEGTYYVVVSSAARMAQQLNQFAQADATNPLVRIEPAESMIRIAEDHINSSAYSTAQEPIVPVLLEETGVVPYHLGDVVLYVTCDTDHNQQVNQSEMVAVDPFTGAVEVTYGAYGYDVGDLANSGGQFYALSLDVDDRDPHDDTTGNLLRISGENGSASVVGDDGIITYERAADEPYDPVERDTGVNFEAMTFANNVLLAIGYRGDEFDQGDPRIPRGVTFTQNILYVLNANNGSAQNIPQQDSERADGAGTNAIERGQIFTNLTLIAAAGSALTDAMTFTVSDGTTTQTFEFDDQGDEENPPGLADPNAVGINYVAADGPEILAAAIQEAINTTFANTIQATVVGGTVELTRIPDPNADPEEPVDPIVVTADNPLRVAGEPGPGGLITGMTSVGGNVYVVSDTGGLWQITSPNSDNPQAIYIQSSAEHLLGINFAGLTAGPGTVEDGIYGELLFGISEEGTLYAFDTNGIPQPVFLDGATSLETGLDSVQGLAFSSHQSNLWHITGLQGQSYDHGITESLTRIRSRGGSSFLFGQEQQNSSSYGVNGETHGALISNPFDLSEYTVNDKPTLYFNYLALTEGATYNPTSNPSQPMMDAFRVYATEGDSGQWHLLATNDGFRSTNYSDEFDYYDPYGVVDVEVQELFDYSDGGSWRQVRIPLGGLAGLSDVRLRFEFTSAGSYNLGDIDTTGYELRMRAGADIVDGEVVVIGTDSVTGEGDEEEVVTELTTFEFDSGYTLRLPNGVAVNEGDTITIDGKGTRTYIEFDTDDSVGRAIFVPPGTAFADGDTFSITDGTDTVVFEFDTGYTMFIPADAAQTINHRDTFYVNDNEGSGTVSFQFTTGGPGNGTFNIAVTEESTQDEIAEAVVFAILEANIGLTPTYLGEGEIYLGGTTHTIDISGVPTLELVGQPGAQTGDIAIPFNPAAEPRAVDMATMIVDAINGAGLNLTASAPDFELFLDGDGAELIAGTSALTYRNNTAITVNSETPAASVASLVYQAILNDPTLGVIPWMASNQINLQGATNLSITPDSFLEITGEPGTLLADSVPVRIHSGMTAEEVADALANAMAATFSGFGVRFTAIEGSQLSLGDTITITDGVDTLEVTIDDSYADMTAEQVAQALRNAIHFSPLDFEATVNGRQVDLLGDGFTVDVGSTGITIFESSATVKRYGGVVNVIGHTVEDPGNMFLAQELFGDTFGNFSSAARSQSNGFSGVFVDDIIIGFASRGEMVTKANADTTFVSDPSLPDYQILEGSYQLEVRRGTEYGVGYWNSAEQQYVLELLRSFEPSDRFTEAAAIIVPSGAEIPEGMSFTLGDGFDEVTFVFEEYGTNTIVENGGDLASALDTELVAGAAGYFSARGTIGLPEDVDFFAIDLAAGDNVTIDIDAATVIDGRAPVSYLDSVLRLFDANGNELAYSDDMPAPGEDYGPDSYIDFTAFEAGRYYVGISAYSNYYYDPFVSDSGYGSQIGDYRVEIQLNGGQPTGGVILPFTSEYTAAEIANLVATTINSDAIQAILDIQASTSLNGSRVFLDGSVTLVSGFAGSVLREPDDTLAQAYDSGIGPDRGGTFRATGAIGDSLTLEDDRLDVDLIMLQLAAGETITIDIDAYENGSSLDSMLRLFDSTGMELAMSDDMPAPDEDSGLDSYIEFTAEEAGVYYVGVSGYSNYSYDPTIAGSGTAGSTGVYSITITRDFNAVSGLEAIISDFIGDNNRHRDQGQLIIESNVITSSQQWGILIDAGTRDSESGSPHQGPVRNFGIPNPDELAPGVTVVNNILSLNGEGGIRFSGDTTPDNGQAAAVPFGRIINNTIYGTRNGDVGIQVDENASPTILNTIIARTGTGLDIDATSQSTVLGGMLFQDNGTNSTGGLGDQAIVLGANESLFVNAAAGNFYLNAGSRAIDSALKSLGDRAEMVGVREPLGIDDAPILAPELDAFGSFRGDDPNVQTPLGLGETVFVDRGAIDRVDFEGPTVRLITPADSDGDTTVQSNNRFTQFILQLDDAGTGVSSNTVNGNKVILERDGVQLIQGTDYTFRYDETNGQIRLIAGSGVWAGGFYRITLDNTAATGIRDIANNVLRANQTTGYAQFTIQLGGGADYGDAPDPSYPTLRAAGAAHTIVPGFYLGFGVDAEGNGEPSTTANTDAFDDGVSFNTNLYVTGQAQITVRASAAGYLDGWIDFNRDGSWTAAEKIFASTPLVEGLNTLTFNVPAGVTAVPGKSFARFRFSSTGGLTPGGAAADGEVEDYQVQLLAPPWQNPTNHLDVSGDGIFSARDVLLLSNFLYFNGQVAAPELPGTSPFPEAPAPYYDVNGDSFVGIQDALLLVNALRNQPAGEGEGLVVAPVTSATVLATSVETSVTPDAPTPTDGIHAATGRPSNGAVAESAELAAWAPLVIESSYVSQTATWNDLARPTAEGSSIYGDTTDTGRPESAVDLVLSDEWLTDEMPLANDVPAAPATVRGSDTLDAFFAGLADSDELVTAAIDGEMD